MKTSIDERAGAAGPRGAAAPVGRRAVLVSLLRVVGALAIPIVAFIVLWATFDFLRDTDANRILVVGRRDRRRRGRCVLPLLGHEPRGRLPSGAVSGRCATVRLRRPRPRHLDRVSDLPGHQHHPGELQGCRGESFVGLDNYRFVFTDESMLRAIRNTFGWIVIVPLFGVSIGLAFATLADRLRRGEAIAKSMIFLPMAISFAGATITWRLIYSFRPEDSGRTSDS